MTDFEYVVRPSSNADSKNLSLLLRKMLVDRGISPSRDQPFLVEKDLHSGKFWCYVACEASSGNVVGFCFFFNNYSTRDGASLAICDIFVQGSLYKRGLYMALIQAVLNHDKRCAIRRLDMQVPQSSNAVIGVLEEHKFENLSSSTGWLDYFLGGSALRKLIKARVRQGISMNNDQKDCDIYIRPATSADAPHIPRFIHELARFHNVPENPRVNSDNLFNDLENNHCLCYLAINAETDTAIGIVFLYFAFSAEHGSSVHIEEIFVDEHYRGRGIGTALIQVACHIALKMGAERVELQVLDVNLRTKRYYEKIGFVDICDSYPIVNYRIKDNAFGALQLAERSPHIKFM